MIIISIYIYILLKYDNLKLVSSCRIVAPVVQKIHTRIVLYLLICYTYLVYPLSGLPIFTKVPPSLATPVKLTTYQAVCQAEGFPRPIITWRRVGMSLPAGKTEENQGTLTIKNLTPADSGLYECIATNSMGTKRARINVVVQQQFKLGMLCF